LKVRKFPKSGVNPRVLTLVVFLSLAFSELSFAQTSIFSIQNTPNPDALGNTLNASSAVSTSDAWAVGFRHDNNLNGSRTLAMHWDGGSWSAVDTPNPGNTPDCRNGNTGNVLNGIAASASDDVWAVGFSFNCHSLLQPMILHWDGAQWKAAPSPKLRTNDNAALNGVVVLARDNAFAVGYQPAPNGAVETLIEHWDGSSWTVMASPNPTTGNVLSAVSANSGSDIWAVGTRVDIATTSVQTLIQHFDGSTWKTVPSPNPLPKVALNQNVLTGVQASSGNDVTAVGFLNDAIHQRTVTLIEHWNGSKWSVVPSPNRSIASGSLNAFRGVTAVSGSDVYAVGFFENATTNGQDETLVAHFDGTAWRIVSSPTRDLAQQLNGAFALPGTGNVWVVGASSQNGIDIETGLLQTPITLVLFTPIG